MKGPDAGPEQIKAYTGFLMMSYRVYIEAIERTMRKIETVYLIELGEIIDEADTMMREADELSRRSSKTVEIAQNNLPHHQGGRRIDRSDQGGRKRSREHLRF